MKKSERPRRFIAGAGCPNCRAQDSLYFVDDTDRFFACIECNYQSAAIDNQDESAPQPIKIVNKKIKR